ncbi:fructose-1-phosphate/6-phosphogluconate phosphatase [Kitasatospora herbaricolor]|uniref:HAD family hydrolase n=1 Tax=Kitasatospora herbaricolor TaxID=68217 RepID=UPI00174DFAED|nr:HAD family phosphatase [Kitasatospora herbaricolor]MDQ0306339.1 beta-phosphoglucomutase-like phosphatase (HAD superfamily) [Kitasatospora herbaricolor]GGV40460.1 fructose-1-phosphate/6-phosphogluconate phosphatase [Kitasatospora herbaricolor]
MLPELHPGPAEALLFDWDGTLVDSQYANYRAMADVLAPYGVTLRQEWFDARTGLSSADLIRALAEEGEEGAAGADLPVEELVAARDLLFLANADRIEVHREVAEVVHAHHGTLPMAVASGGARLIIETTMRHLPYQGLFTALVTRDEVRRGKPAPDIFLRAADALAVPPARCLVYEDSDEGIEAARAAGMAVIDVRPVTRRSR